MEKPSVADRIDHIVSDLQTINDTLAAIHELVQESSNSVPFLYQDNPIKKDE